MPGPTREEMDRYRRVLEQVAMRLEAVDRLLSQEGRGGLEAEWAALQLRTVLELIVFGSLITNRDAISQISSVFKIGPAEARKTMRRANPDYWPTPVDRAVVSDGSIQGTAVTEGFLTEAEWGAEYGFVSQLLHAQSPYEAPRDASGDIEHLRQLARRILCLLSEHWVVILGGQQAFAASINLSKRTVEVARARRLPDEP